MVVNSFDGLACDQLGAKRRLNFTIQPIEQNQLTEPKQPIDPFRQ